MSNLLGAALGLVLCVTNASWVNLHGEDTSTAPLEPGVRDTDSGRGAEKGAGSGAHRDKAASDQGGNSLGDRLLPTFTDLIIGSGSDKYASHHYERYYERWLSPFRHVKNMTVLEIGVASGKSLNLWANYFVHPDLVMGLAYERGHKKVVSAGTKDNGIRVVYGDQSQTNTTDTLRKEGPWNIIIDDGSHVPSHVVHTFFKMWKSIKKGGIYVIEDLETNFWKAGSGIYGYSLPNVGIGAGPGFSAVSKLEQFLNVLVRHQIGAKELSIMPGDEDMCSIEWGMNIVLIRKCGSDDGLGPKYQKPRYDEDRMKTWLTEAKKTNPKLFKRTGPKRASSFSGIL